MYALAGSAAGVGVLALAQPAEAKIIYKPANVHLGTGAIHHYQLDLNDDGVKDFSFSYTYPVDHSAGLLVQPLPLKKQGANGVLNLTGFDFPSDLPTGAVVGPKRHFQTAQQQVMAWWHEYGNTQSSQGNWRNVKNRYLGLKFLIKGKVHYGWARLSVSFRFGDIQGTLTGYAYETIANKPIIAGKTEGPEEGSVDEANPAALSKPALKPASLGLLSMGSPGLSAWRREESVAEAP
jgi:hypothetical protein